MVWVFRARGNEREENFTRTNTSAWLCGWFIWGRADRREAQNRPSKEVGLKSDLNFTSTLYLPLSGRHKPSLHPPTIYHRYEHPARQQTASTPVLVSIQSPPAAPLKSQDPSPPATGGDLGLDLAKVDFSSASVHARVSDVESGLAQFKDMIKPLLPSQAAAGAEGVICEGLSVVWQGLFFLGSMPTPLSFLCFAVTADGRW